ncbi:MAG: C1 family peptidase [Prevotellaceae bacterium]|jgi:bleomycin hydrolase|nr:C1 family peptidase [Prevotellaceae bacterium]
MKKYLITIAAIGLLSVLSLTAQKKDEKVEKKFKEYEFSDLKILPHTSVKNQASSGTCWSFSGLSMLESEIIRTKGDTVDLSAMWVVRNIYKDKVEKYVRMHKEVNLAAGGSFADVIHASVRYGFVPEQSYRGLNYGSDRHNHNELDRFVKSAGDILVDTRKLSPGWNLAIDAILDAYLGKVPETFIYKGAEYTPQSFAKYCGLNFDDYVSITSFTHHPFYSSFILEIPDNWIYAPSFNVPMDELMAIVDNAIDRGYTVAWGADVSEGTFSRDRATVFDQKKSEEIGSDQAKWTRTKEKTTVEYLPVEKEITQEMRQLAFDNYETTDDHGMQIVGTAKDLITGQIFFKVKNSWGVGGKYNGYLYVSRAYVQYKTINIVVHKDAIPENIKVKFNSCGSCL